MTLCKLIIGQLCDAEQETQFSQTKRLQMIVWKLKVKIQCIIYIIVTVQFLEHFNSPAAMNFTLFWVSFELLFPMGVIWVRFNKLINRLPSFSYVLNYKKKNSSKLMMCFWNFLKTETTSWHNQVFNSNWQAIRLKKICCDFLYIAIKLDAPLKSPFSKQENHFSFE